MTTETSRDDHRAFLNRYYGATLHVYDATRRPYLLGRDRALAVLLEEPWTSLVEIGVGTGRNLEWLRTHGPEARYGGLDACDAMAGHARDRCPWASIATGFAEDADLPAILGDPPERILFSYSLSMMSEPERAVECAMNSVAVGGSIVAVDFGTFEGLPGFAALTLRAWLARFRVRPLPKAFWTSADTRMTSVAGSYAVIAVIRPER